MGDHRGVNRAEHRPPGCSPPPLDLRSPPCPTPHSPTTRSPSRRALVSVYDKTGLDELVRGLHDAGVELVSTGGSAALIAELGLPVTRVEDLTGFPECLDGRVKTLHPRVHAGILADRRLESHVQQLAELEVEPFDLVVSNLYPFTATVASGASPDECVEQIDIGGPSMVRAAAKNHPSVAIVTSPERYDDVLRAVGAGGFTLAERRALAAEAFVHTATYDVHVASWMGNVLTDTSDGSGFPAWMGATWTKQAVLRYGENPHQRAAVYASGFVPVPGLAQAEQLHGKEMSYNNYVDADAARRAAYDFDRPAVAIIKHANPCGIAVGDDVAEAHRKAHECDPVSAFGGVIATNVPVSVAMAEQVAEVFTEVIVAPGYEDGAVEVLAAKKNIRILVCAPAGRGWRRDPADLRRPAHPGEGCRRRPARRGRRRPGHAGRSPPARRCPTPSWPTSPSPGGPAGRSSPTPSCSPATAPPSASGMGQVNRVDSCRLAVERAGERAAGSYAASDAFFPFADGAQVLVDAGVRAIVQPGGSMRDSEVVEAVQAAGITMYFTGTRHFFH